MPLADSNRLLKPWKSARVEVRPSFGRALNARRLRPSVSKITSRLLSFFVPLSLFSPRGRAWEVLLPGLYDDPFPGSHLRIIRLIYRLLGKYTASNLPNGGVRREVSRICFLIIVILKLSGFFLGTSSVVSFDQSLWHCSFSNFACVVKYVRFIQTTLSILRQ